MSRRALLLLAGAALFLAACAGPPVGEASPAATGDRTNEAPSEWTGMTRHVPLAYPTIQAAVDAADPGDLVLIEPGVYKEQVSVTTPGITIRGVDRNEVIIDGEFERGNAIEVLFADGVVVENLTVMNARVNGVFWNGARGYRASYVTSINNAVYGIYAFDSGDGLFEHSYASGSPDAGYYIGQCDPCDAVITDVIAEWNGVGYSGTNASTELYIVNSVWRYNGTGIAPNTLDSELLPPIHDVTVVGNIVHDNGRRDAPMLPWQWAAQGHGIMIAGGHSSYIARNLIVNHPLAGVAIVPMLDRNFYMSRDHVVEDNDIRGSGLAHIALNGPAGSGSCFSGNADAHTMPPALEFKQSCDGPRFPALFELGATTAQLGFLFEAGTDQVPAIDFDTIPQPEPQPQMPGGADAPVRPAVNVFADAKPDIDAISTPAMPSDLEVTQEKGINIMGVTFASAAGIFFGLYAYVLPLVLYTSWVVLALWDLAKREDLGKGKTIGWMAAVLILPFVGVIAYYIFGKSTIPAWQRWAFMAGGMLVYVLFLGLGMLVGGIL